MNQIYFRLLGDESVASSRVRGYWIARELAGFGHDVHLEPRKNRPRILDIVREGLKYDVVVFQKCYTRHDVVAATMLKALGRKIAFDIDDAPSKSNNPRTMRNARRMMRLSHRVFAGSHALADMARNAGGRVTFIPSGIRLANYPQISRQKTVDAPLCLGWIGNGGQYGPDVAATLERPLRNIAQRTPIRLRIVGSCGHSAFTKAFGNVGGLKLEMVDSLNWADPKEISSEISRFDIGLYPLHETPFNRFKCAFKALEYMASDVPVVASAVGANADVITHGHDGYLANSEAEWTASLWSLISDSDLRQRMGRAGRQKIETAYNTGDLAMRMIAELG